MRNRFLSIFILCILLHSSKHDVTITASNGIYVLASRIIILL